MTAEPFTRYVVVVHGIGEQRKNETVLNVVRRFAEARRGGKSDPEPPLTLGQATGQTGKPKNPLESQDGKPWIEFEGIPKENKLVTEPFLGERSVSGENIRFVDMCWSDIMQDDFEDVGQDVEAWADGMVGRLKLKNEAAKEDPNKMVPGWVLRILGILVETLVLIKWFLSFRAKDIGELIFGKFLGDAQLYGEYTACRGKAVRRFHDMMAKVESEHHQQRRRRMERNIKNGVPPEEADEMGEARYTIIAHSLGSIMSLDALLFAAAKQNIRSGDVDDFRNLPFLGYKNSNPQLPRTTWLKRVDGFVTLGSPIDKYLVLWWLNYRYLLQVDWMSEPYLKRSDDEKIPHFNFCDEQDPVGHRLDVARSARAVNQLFRSREEDEQVFTRYVVPGAAHNAYWKDLELFSFILAKVIDFRTGVEEPPWFKSNVYRKVLRWFYTVIPLAVILLDYLAFTFAWYAKDKFAVATATVVFVLVCWLGRRLIRLSILWRVALLQKAASRSGPQIVKKRFGWYYGFLILLAFVCFFAFLAVPGNKIQILLLSSGVFIGINVLFLLLNRGMVGLTCGGKTQDFQSIRQAHGERFRWSLGNWLAIHLYLAAVSIAIFLGWGFTSAPEGQALEIPKIATMFLVAALTMLALIFRNYLRAETSREEGDRRYEKRVPLPLVALMVAGALLMGCGVLFAWLWFADAASELNRTIFNKELAFHITFNLMVIFIIAASVNLYRTYRYFLRFDSSDSEKPIDFHAYAGE